MTMNNKLISKYLNHKNELIIDAYVFLYGGMISIFMMYVSLFPDSSHPLGTFLLIIATFIVYLLYVLINHLLTRYVLGHIIPLIVEILLLLSLILYFYVYFAFIYYYGSYYNYRLPLV